MNRTNKRILDLQKGNEQLCYPELGDAIGKSRIAAKMSAEIPSCRYKSEIPGDYSPGD